MVPRPRSLDTSPEVEQMQIERWRTMTPAEKLGLGMRISQFARDLAFVGIRQRHPSADAREQRLRFAVLTLGRELALKACPESHRFDP